MFARFFTSLKGAGVPVSITELLTLLEALKSDLAGSSVQHFYHLARTCLVKDERHYDRYDRVFGETSRGSSRRSPRSPLPRCRRTGCAGRPSFRSATRNGAASRR